MATRYWVGGTGTWDASSTSNWAATTGGASGASAPTSADTVIFDASSGTGTCTTASGSVCAVATLNTATVGLTLGANHTMSGLFTLTLGTLNLNNNVLTAGSFNANNSNARTIAFGTGNITLTGNAATIFNVSQYNGLTVTGTPVINCTYSGSTGTRTLASGTVNATEALTISINITAGSDIVAITANTTIKNLIFTGFTGTYTSANLLLYGNLTLGTGMTYSAAASAVYFQATLQTQTIQSNGVTINQLVVINTASQPVILQDNMTLGTAYFLQLLLGTLNLNNNILSCGVFTSSNANTRVIAFGTGNITTTGSGTVWQTATATNFSYTGTPTINISNNSATATTVNTGAMTSAQALNFNYTTGTYTLTDTSAVYKTVNFTGFSGTIPNSARTIYGGLTVSAGMTLTAGANVTTFAATSGTNNITTAAKTFDFPITFNGIGGTWAFQDALTQGSTRAFTITNGTVQLKASATSTTGAFATSGTNQKYLQSTTPGTQATLTQASGTVDASYLSIKDIIATGGATWNALWSNNNVDEGNNSGWVFGDPPIISAVEYTYALRSFTQPRRF